MLANMILGDLTVMNEKLPGISWFSWDLVDCNEDWYTWMYYLFASCGAWASSKKHPSAGVLGRDHVKALAQECGEWRLFAILIVQSLMNETIMRGDWRYMVGTA